MGIVQKQTKPLGTLDVFLMGVFVCPIDINPSATIPKHCWAGMKKQWRGCKKWDMQVLVLFRSGWCQFRKLLRENPGLENELSSHRYLKNSPINIWDGLYGVEPKSPNMAQS